ncbi:Threonine/homoserine/homoserine lactone efflux protein [Polaromonas sp. YR568]|uniref:LysE family translocator n=1 Tax=Polaromonas sp. YR568 TaxID=1855301 RepID=UPI0008E85CAC|nr:LysE family translocator [Polaromonas sp. YR568]SFU70005.1 Threonine/homoserine/homoserine lactone efflux protein [Polaromonas sp. YR568]
MHIEVSWLLFIATSLVIIITPGQDMVLVMSRSIAQGASAGVATAAGVSVGLIGHTLLATLGLGAILLASEWLFTALKLVGAAYLIYIGISLLRTKDTALLVEASSTRSRSRLFWDGALSNVSNPKVAVFYFAFLPQFVTPGATQPTLAVFVLGLTFAALTFLVKGPVGYGAGMLSGWLRERPGVLKWVYRSSGAVLVGLGIKLAFERKP